MADVISFLDLPETCEHVVIDAADHTVKVSGLSATGAASILQRFPDLLRAIDGRLEPTSLAKVAPEAIAAVIAAACGHAGEAQAEAKAERLSLEVQLDILSAAWRLTFRKGFGTFIRDLNELSEAIRATAADGPVGALGKGRAH